jgi:hypothetical protein
VAAVGAASLEAASFEAASRATVATAVSKKALPLPPPQLFIPG